MLGPERRAQLEQRSAAEERTSGNQVVVAIFPSLEGESLEDVSIRLGERWKIGQAGRNNGVILLVFLKEHKLRIEVGYGLEARLPDALASSIIRNEIAPRFREQRYADGIDAGLAAIFKAIAGEYQARAREPQPDVTLGPAATIGVFVLMLAFAIMILSVRRGRPYRRRGYTAGPGGWYFGGGGFGAGFGGGGFGGGGGSFGGGGSSGSW